MAYASATFADARSFDGPAFALGDFRRVGSNPLVIISTTLAGTCAIGIAAIFGAAWLFGAVLSTNPHFHRAPLTPELSALDRPYLRVAGTAQFAGSARLLTQLAYARDLALQAELHRTMVAVGEPAPVAAAPEMRDVASLPPARQVATLPKNSRLVVLPPRPHVARAGSMPSHSKAALAKPARRQLARLDNGHVAPLPRPRPTRAIAAALKQFEVAALTPPAPAIIPPSGVLPLPAKQPAQPKPHIPSLPPQTTQAVKTEAKRDEAPAQSKRSAPLVTGSLPPPESSPKQLTVRQALTGDIALPAPGSRTAVYDIEAHTVYMPDGRQLEAHSGLGNGLDNPRYVAERRRGPTPPNIYNLTLRRAIFHGVRAVRLNPVDEDAMHGRDGMLAHTYMLGPSGRSFGCVSFKHYSVFLHAFLKGEVDRLVVVPRLKTRITRTAPVPNHHYAFNAED